jgi:uncharacterized protein (TIGR02001 family)
MGEINMMKFACKAIALSIFAVTSTFAMAEETNTLSQYGLSFSGNAALTTDYRYRGMTQTQSDPALQGGFALSHSSGLYAGVWGSNVNFGSADPHLELDPYVGYATELPFAGKPKLDVGLWYYGYPSASDFNWLELYAKLGFSSVIASGDSLLAAVNYTNDFFGLEEDAWYLNATYTIPFADTGFGGVRSNTGAGSASGAALATSTSRVTGFFSATGAVLTRLAAYSSVNFCKARLNVGIKPNCSIRTEQSSP